MKILNNFNEVYCSIRGCEAKPLTDVLLRWKSGIFTLYETYDFTSITYLHIGNIYLINSKYDGHQ